jgi:hypothetical protein
VHGCRTIARRMLLLAGALALAALVMPSLTGALGKSSLPCKHGCDVHVGTYKGTNDDNGKAVTLHVAAGHFDYGSHKEGAHIINHFKTEFVVTCDNGVKSNVYIDTTHRGHINGIRGHMRLGERYMEVLWDKDDRSKAVGHVTYRSPGCSGTTHFNLHRVHH